MIDWRAASDRGKRTHKLANCVVIGANGFIGSHLVDELARRGHTVSAFDRFSAGKPSFEAAGVRTIQGDFNNRADLQKAVAGQDHVFHFLSTTTPITADNDPSVDVRMNVAQTVELLDACVGASVQKFYFASTGGAIYGDQGDGLLSESAPTEPVSPYAIGKLSIEHYLRYFRVKHGLDSTIFRISNPYGTRQHPGKLQGLIPIAARRMIRGEHVIRYGDGSMVRDYVLVNDLVKMIAEVVDRSPAHSVYNLGSGVGNSVNEVLECLSRASGLELLLEQHTVPKTFLKRVVLDTSRFQQEFGPVPLTSLDSGVLGVLNESIAEFGTSPAATP